MSQTLAQLSNLLLSRFFELFQSTLNLASSPIVQLLDAIHSNAVFLEDARDLEQVLGDLRRGMSESVKLAYDSHYDHVVAEMGGWNSQDVVVVLLSMLQWITARAKSYARQFPEPFLA